MALKVLLYLDVLFLNQLFYVEQICGGISVGSDIIYNIHLLSLKRLLCVIILTSNAVVYS